MAGRRPCSAYFDGDNTVQLLIVTEAISGYAVGDIVAVQPDTHVWGRAETMEAWLADGNRAADFPTPGFGVIRMPSEPCDLNLAEPWIQLDPDPAQRVTLVVAKSLWFVDLGTLPPGQRRRLLEPGGQATLGRNRRSAIKNKATGASLPLRPESNGNSRHRHGATNSRLTVN